MTIKNNIQQSILKSIEMIAENAIKKARFDKTVIGIVIEVLGNNQYKVMYNNNQLILNCAVDISLSNGNTVYITFPQGNYNNAYISGIKRK